jgi:hypothetical protein
MSRADRTVQVSARALLIGGLLALVYAAYVVIDARAYQAIERRRFEHARQAAAATAAPAPPLVEGVAVGTKVEVTRQDGGVVRGSLAARDEKTVKVTVGSTGRSVPRDQIAGVQPRGTVLSLPLDPAVDVRVPIERS